MHLLSKYTNVLVRTDLDNVLNVFIRFNCSTVYRENFALVLFSPFSPSDPRANLKLG